METQPLDISVVIPFKDKSKMTIQGLRSLLRHGPPLQEILLVSGNSSPAELAAVQAFADRHDNIRVLEYNHPFNYQKACNWGARQTSASSIMFLNNDIELRPESTGLIEHMLKKATRPDIGIVGCLLLYGDASTIQHAGVFLMPKGTADHVYVGKKYAVALRKTGSRDFPYDPRQDRAMSAVTGAISLVERRKFEAVKGFDEQFILCGGDVDLCLRLNKAGYQTWYVGKGYMLHKESQSRSSMTIDFNDFYRSYLSYMEGFDPAVGDPFLPKITKHMR